MNKVKEQVLLGSLLGDGYLRINGNNPGYGERHSIKQLEYLKWKNKFLGFKLALRESHDKRQHKSYRYCGIESKTKQDFWYYYNMFYHNGRKRVTRNILNKLELLGIVVWFCDDGSYGYLNSIIRLSVGCFNHNERLLIIKYFKQKWNIKFEIIEDNLCLNVVETQKFIKLIKSILPKCMDYKLGKDLKKKEQQKSRRQKSLKKYYKENKEIIRAKHKKYYKTYYYKNRDRILPKKREQMRKYRERNRKKLLKYYREYYWKNRDKLLRWKREHYKKNNS